MFISSGSVGCVAVAGGCGVVWGAMGALVMCAVFAGSITGCCCAVGGPVHDSPDVDKGYVGFDLISETHWGSPGVVDQGVRK